VKGVFAGVLTLIIIQALGTSKGPEQGGKLLVWLSKGVEHALSPKVAAIPTAKKAPPGKKAPAAKPGEISLPRNPSVGGGGAVYV
jgi:hypothetical protein